MHFAASHCHSHRSGCKLEIMLLPSQNTRRSRIQNDTHFRPFTLYVYLCATSIQTKKIIQRALPNAAKWHKLALLQVYIFELQILLPTWLDWNCGARRPTTKAEIKIQKNKAESVWQRILYGSKQRRTIAASTSIHPSRLFMLLLATNLPLTTHGMIVWAKQASCVCY